MFSVFDGFTQPSVGVFREPLAMSRQRSLSKWRGWWVNQAHCMFFCVLPVHRKPSPICVLWLCPPRRPGGRGKGEPRPKAVNARYLSVGWGKMCACQTSGSVVKTVVPILLVKLQKQARSVRKIHVDYWGSTPRSHVAAMYLHLFAYSLQRKCSVKVPKSTHTRTHDRRPT